MVTKLLEASWLKNVENLSTRACRGRVVLWLLSTGVFCLTCMDRFPGGLVLSSGPMPSWQCVRSSPYVLPLTLHVLGSGIWVEGNDILQECWQPSHGHVGNAPGHGPDTNLLHQFTALWPHFRKESLQPPASRPLSIAVIHCEGQGTLNSPSRLLGVRWAPC